jgi:hypothetical protein
MKMKTKNVGQFYFFVLVNDLFFSSISFFFFFALHNTKRQRRRRRRYGYMGSVGVGIWYARSVSVGTTQTILVDRVRGEGGWLVDWIEKRKAKKKIVTIYIVVEIVKPKVNKTFCKMQQ